MLAASRIPKLIIVILAVLVALASYRYLITGFSEAFGGLGSARADKTLLLGIHVTIAPLALAVGVVQFFQNIRTKHPFIHKICGWIYVASVTVSGLASILIAPHVPGGWVSGLGFGLLGLLWLLTTAIAVFNAHKRRFVVHQRWMVRSYALTLAAVTLRLYLPVFFLNGFEYDQAAPWLAWLCWVPNLLLAEILMKKLTVNST